MAAPAPPFPVFSRVDLTGTATLKFSDGGEYTFDSPGLLAEAQEKGRNAHMQEVGVNRMYRIVREGWYRSPDPESLWRRLYVDGMGEKVYLGWIANAAGVRQNVMMKGGISAGDERYNTEEDHRSFTDKAYAVEALVGAVYLDCRDDNITSEVMRRLGVFWPVSQAEHAQLVQHLDRLRGIGVLKP